MYVARFTECPEYDVRRNWSAWIGSADTIEALVEIANPLVRDDFEEQSDVADYDEYLELEADKLNMDIRLHEYYGEYVNVHHAGLSAWGLSATDESSARVEAMVLLDNSEIQRFGFGVRTLGQLKYVGVINAALDLHLFECDDYCPEN